MTMNQSRVRPGVREGGQWDRTIHAESGIVLDYDLDWSPGDPLSGGWGETPAFSTPEAPPAPAPRTAGEVSEAAARQLGRSAALALVGGRPEEAPRLGESNEITFTNQDGAETTLDAAHILNAARHRAAAVISSRTRAAANNDIDSEDMAQETILAVLENVRAGKRVENPEGYIRSIGKTIGTKMVYGDERWEDRNGMRIYHQKVQEFQETHMRTLTRNEEDTIAQDIRDSFPPGTRPTMGFHCKKRNVSINEQTSEGSEYGDVLLANQGFAHVDDYSHIETDGTLSGDMGLVNEIYEKLGQRNSGNQGVSANAVVAAQSMAWDALASFSGAPRVARGTIGSKAMTAARNVMGKIKTPLQESREAALEEKSLMVERAKKEEIIQSHETAQLRSNPALKGQVEAARRARHQQEMKIRAAAEARIREIREAPTPEGMTERGVRREREQKLEEMREDSIRRAINDWQHGEDTPHTGALFAPFGDLSIEEKDAVVEQFQGFVARGRGVAYPMWNGAMAAASSRLTRGEPADA